ncbi:MULTISPECIES: effector-associated domain EAD1-containing protein [unclassified Frankia]|uniref:effector-associated domain EAD1-containing protein n=1 Tax=unclassified Frankia TaxID=2632575 RepID=UPI0020248DE7
MAGLDEAKVAGMNGAQRRAAQDALLAAYPDRGRLERLLDRLDRPLAHYATESVTLPDAVFKIFEGAKAEGWLPRLLAEATAVNPGNPSWPT